MSEEILARMNMAVAWLNFTTAQANHDLQRYGEWRCDYAQQASLFQEDFDKAGREFIALQEPQSFQSRVQPWMMECFGDLIAGDREERNHRFLEESLELVQACGCTEYEALRLVYYVYSRPKGEEPQEVGGVMVTLAALCLANQMDMHACGETELARIWTMVDQIRAKQAAKPKHSPLPAPPQEPQG